MGREKLAQLALHRNHSLLGEIHFPPRPQHLGDRRLLGREALVAEASLLDQHSLHQRRLLFCLVCVCSLVVGA